MKTGDNSLKNSDIDLVYLYVNGNDIDWIKRKNEYTGNRIDICRFRDNDELKYSLRSVEKYASWVRKIFIVVDSALPSWLDTSSPRINIIRQEDIMPQELLPCYNSEVIESFLPYIPGLSEKFIYANDDMFFGNTVSLEFFFNDDKPVVRLVDANCTRGSQYNDSILHSRALIASKYGKEFDFIPWHNIDAYTKSGMMSCIETFHKEYAAFRRNKVRISNGLQRVLFHYYFMANNLCETRIYKSRNRGIRYVRYCKELIVPSKYLDWLYVTPDSLDGNSNRSIFHRLMLRKKPRVFCINDTEQTGDEAIEKAKAMLEELFPHKSEFELAV